MPYTGKLAEVFSQGISWGQLEKLSLHTFTTEHDLLKAVKTLHELYVKKREDLDSSTFDVRLASAYLYFYFSTNLPKLAPLLERLPESLVKEMALAPWIDFGAGPATYTLAWYSWLQVHKLDLPAKGCLVEKDNFMRQLSNNVLDEFLSDSEIEIKPSLSIDIPENSLLFFGHSLNELTLEESINLIDQVRPRYVVLLEPGTPECFRKVLALKHALHVKKYFIHYPCTQQQSCPMFKDSTNWCHQYVSVRFDPQVERLTQLLDKNRRDSPVIFHVYEKLGVAQSTYQATVLRGPMKFKGLIKWQVCSNHGVIENIETMTKTLDDDTHQRCLNLIPGMRINFQKIQQLKDQSFRVQLAFDNAP